MRYLLPGVVAGGAHGLAFWVAEGVRGGVLLVVMVSTVVLLPLVVEALFASPESGTPAPADLQAVADECARYLHARPVPVRITHEESGLASVRGVLPSKRVVQLAPSMMHAPPSTTRAIIAHELAHVSARHQLASAVGAWVSWVVPAAVAALGHLTLPEAWYLPIGIAHGAATVASVLAWCHAMRQQELVADTMATRCPGVREALVAHLAVSGGAQLSDLFSLHPAPARRLSNLTAGAPGAP